MVEQILNTFWGWIILGLILCGLEMILPGVFLLWLGLGAIAVGILMILLVDLPLGWQWVIFSLTMVGSLGLGFLVQRRSKPSGTATSLNKEFEQMVGKRYVALTTFKAGRGRIKVADSSYAAVSDQPILQGEVVEVIALEDNRPRVARPSGS